MDELKVAPRPTGVGEMFQLLRDGQPRTRSDLASLTGQARSTIAARVDALLGSGLVSPAGEATSTGGRPPATFAFNPAARVVLAVDLGATHSRLAVTDLAGTVLAEQGEQIAIADGPRPVLDRVADLGLELLAQARRDPRDLVSVGVGLPGPVEHSTGRPINPPIMPGWDDADVPGLLTYRLGVPVLVDNDVNIMAVGEHAAAWRSVDHLLFVKVATGIGAGIISDGAIRRGAQGAAGDLGHVAVPGGSDLPCRCGNTGCLEAVAAGPAIAAALSARGLAAHDSADVVALVRSGDPAAGREVRDAGRHIGEVLAACVSMLNPSTIVVGGIVAEAGEQLLAGIREVVYRRSLPLATQHLRIVTSRTGARAGVLGAATMAAEHVLSAAAVDALVS
ncbi:ROK family protein [Cellulomonas fimi]|uniref:ROK family protein n=1 Tax=Cellulomonas fimi (strain ATCC 484 / DSM 20113 / JCM 1341 / CCUG 24087 / LMG 16345 / NBRC 15513 / NCIMB 8980 / NCTC 7547 / NRS-133) TaxID=590998 RepID=F4H7B2_CELFA|nr:ROK family protein [Cellulomonas fimi]AEE46873.1 ROK family protein [Cellulomonas fimi ATCC 484]NNH06416.1 ROK family protein [Cellulomonas fimi]VEH34430.1 Making large colonies protein [Cellulomonas fimi]